jgi:hypothetical protein
MSQAANIINSLIQGTRRLDPRLADLLSLMNNELNRIAVIVDPPPIVSSRAEEELGERPADITTFSYFFTKTSIVLFWEAPQDGFLIYEIRTNSSSFSDGDTITRVTSLTVILDPADFVGGIGPLGAVGDKAYTIMPFDENGQNSVNEGELIVTVPPLGAISLTPSVINNQVILMWTEPDSTFNIDHYEIYKDSVLIQDNIRGTFFVIQEIAGGTFTYGVRAVDIAGNNSALATVTLNVNDPTDYEVQNEFLSTFSGTKTNVYLEDGTLLACVNTPETYENHFLSRFWNSPQNQVDAGFPLVVQPAAATGSYVEVIDFGANFTNNIVSYNWQHESIASSVTISVSTRYSTDAISWSSPITGTQILIPGPMRYIEVTLSFVSAL